MSVCNATGRTISYRFRDIAYGELSKRKFSCALYLTPRSVIYCENFVTLFELTNLNDGPIHTEKKVQCTFIPFGGIPTSN